MKSIYILIIVFSLLMGSAPASAAILYLKDGRAIDGKILGRNDYSITIESNGIPAKYYTDQVDHIIEDKDFGSNPLGIEASKIDPAAARKTNLVITLLEANGTIEKIRSNMEQAIENSGIDNKENLRSLFNINEMTEILIPIYNESYTEVELEALVKFYQSPLGKKVLQTSPQILEKTMKANVQYFQEKLAH